MGLTLAAVTVTGSSVFHDVVSVDFQFHDDTAFVDVVVAVDGAGSSNLKSSSN